MSNMIRVQTEDFIINDEYEQLRADSPSIGAIVMFTGLVREIISGEVADIYLEHYPVMTEKVLTGIVQQATSRWPIITSRIIHRVGNLSLGDNIVFVGVNSPHRKEAFMACEFIVDFLKLKAPFWKKEISQHNEQWVDAKVTDQAAEARWNDA